MPNNMVENIVSQSIQQATGRTTPTDGGIENFLTWATRTSELLPPWWSRSRDKALSEIWKQSDHLSIAVYNTQAKIVGIPPAIFARDQNISRHIVEAEELFVRIFASAQFGKGWEVAYSRFVEALLTQDNGAFMEIIGYGPADGPIIGAPLTVRTLDSARCTRTGDPIYPVIYTDSDSQKYKMHWTRIIYISQMPSSLDKMKEVGFCAVSRSANIAQTLVDMIRYKQERLGSRPMSQILLGKGITAKEIMLAMRRAEQELSNKGLTRYAKTIAIGSQDSSIDMERIDLNHLDPFDEEIGTNLGMFAIAAAFGMDADEIWPVGGKSAGKQEANIRRMRSRGRLPAQITSELAKQFSFKVIPGHLGMAFDFHDDEEDMQQANVRDIRARNRERDLGSGTVNLRSARLQMLEEGDLTRHEFNRLELVDGRLPDGSSISRLFFERDPLYQELLGGLREPLQIEKRLFEIREIVDQFGVSNKSRKLNNEEFVAAIVEIQAAREQVLQRDVATFSERQKEKVLNSFYALDWLEEQYSFAAGRTLPSVPIVHRRSRTDIRVAPGEESPPPGEQSAAQSQQVIDENIDTLGGG